MTEIKRVEYFDDRFYKVEEKYYPSVTTILNVIDKPGLARWRGDVTNKEADRIMIEAQDKGSRIHYAWEVYCNGGSIGYYKWQSEEKPECDFAFTNQHEMVDLIKLIEFRKLLKPDILSSEATVYSDKHEYAGTIDNVFSIEKDVDLVNGRAKDTIEKGLYIVDLKTGKTVSDEAYMQLAAYAKAYEETGLGTVKGAMILHTGSTTKTGIPGFSLKLRSKEKLEQDFNDFLNAKALWHRKNPNMQPKIFDFPRVVKWEESEN